MFEMLEKAAQVAIKRFDRSVDRRTFYVGAIGFRQDGTIVHARNEATDLPNKDVHAEARLCRKLGFFAPVVFVARYSRGNNCLAIAKPCQNCMAKLRAYKVQSVIYSTGPDTFEKEIL